MGNVVNSLAFPVPNTEFTSEFVKDHACTVWLSCTPAMRVPAMYVRPQRTPRRFTLLFSHGNGEDIGLLMHSQFLNRLANVTGCALLAYEYPGYSAADGTPSERNCYKAVQAAAEWLEKEKGVRKEDIVVVGRSLGSGPSVDLCSKSPGQYAGLALISPIESGARAVFNKTTSRVGYLMDIFRNYEKISKCKVPTLIMHGDKDEVVPVENGQNLWGLVNEQDQFKAIWIPGKGHNNIETMTCANALKQLIDHLDRGGGGSRRGSQDK
uniref:Peptidase S9 prolyl oligopeptidase catalytic domain-containing protein n=1 Tax=Chromera velia CCMP2878 TaxID=1169474 RepID=A0A0G4HHR8_9ALVE|mmetsp:Transcript_33038/g.65492  ORF Transcript_33038/g.65492 Transcript_33038/m.65492 type:complete len:267 (-) Transcript_33038:652-1452(-)|eukprot:Cvel_1051.t1-p1 / transcript=Cvel_1051.t1 / gene=Cvel_1051 / organism=Chromera_velia_CCMP2878 / gene_product=Alpha/beta hydrolase domain-containing protein 17B, putative / transcript_product=Alpha/beta hydrolase domain-containing protein 17B, putative / location=Cvel_scaffold34:66955-67752(+) / protein_length=266 / sequence_SO=supercontig / SO=protein_coding / is_pseudo=false